MGLGGIRKWYLRLSVHGLSIRRWAMSVSPPPQQRSRRLAWLLPFAGGLFLGLCLLLGFYWWFVYCRGHIVASDSAFSSGGIITASIREYPTNLNPLNSDGHFYGCEIYSDHILMSSAAFRFDSYTAKSFRIRIESPNGVHFYLDNAYHIECTGMNWGGSKWSQSW